MSTNLTGEMLPLIPHHIPPATESAAESVGSGAAHPLRHNIVSVVAFIALSAIVVYLIAKA